MATPLNRTLLGAAGLVVSEEAYVRAVAFIGATVVPTFVGIDVRPGTFRWSFEKFRDEARPHSRDADSVRYVSGLWPPLADNRLLIEADSISEGSPELLDILRILRHPAVGLEAVAVDVATPHADKKWQWPLRIAAFPDDFAKLRLKRLRDRYPARLLTEVHELSRQRPRADVLIVQADPRGVLERIHAHSFPVRAGYCILSTSLATPWSTLRGDLDVLLAETQAGGASLIELRSPTAVLKALNRWIRNLSHNEPFDQTLAKSFPTGRSIHVVNAALIERAALPTAAKRLAPRLRSLAADTKFVLPGDAFIALRWRNDGPLTDLARELELGELPYFGEDHGATAISLIAAGERDARRAASPTVPPRYLQGDVFWLGDENLVERDAGLLVGRKYRFVVYIAPEKQGSLSAGDPFSDNLLDWDKQDFYTLDLVFTEPRQWPDAMSSTLQLPRYGESTKCAFDFTPTRSGPFAGRVTVMHRGRVLQTAILACGIHETPDAPRAAARRMTFEVEAVVRRNLATLDDRRWFDACLVLNHTSAQKAAMTAAGRGGAHIASLDEIKDQLTAINGLLNKVALDQEPYHQGLTSDENAKLLVALASHGHWLYRKLVLGYIDKSPAGPALRNSEYLQIVSTHPDAMVPLEFVYEYEPPDDGVKVCPNAIRALKAGACPASCVPQDSPAPHVCPLGFWGLRKVIERHVNVDAASLPAAAAAKVVAEPDIGRNVLTLNGPALLATSKEVDAGFDAAGRGSKPSRKLQEQLQSAWQKQPVNAVLTWPEWKKSVGAAPPVLIVALPHAGGKGAEISLEISGDVIKSKFISKAYVWPDPGKPAPIALLLGCDVVNTAYSEAYTRHVTVFRDAHAALVLGTVATVFGKDAADMAGRLVDHLVKAVRAKPGCFGEVLRQAKREAVADSLMIALCLVAFGDADWRVEM
jgi:hypothetical protein